MCVMGAGEAILDLQVCLKGPDLSCLQGAQGMPCWLLAGLPTQTLVGTVLCCVGSALQWLAFGLSCINGF